MGRGRASIIKEVFLIHKNIHNAAIHIAKRRRQADSHAAAFPGEYPDGTGVVTARGGVCAVGSREEDELSYDTHEESNIQWEE